MPKDIKGAEKFRANREARDSANNDIYNARYELYDASVTQALGIRNPTDPADKILLNYLPDPRRVTTPAEALVVLSLSKTEYEQVAARKILDELANNAEELAKSLNSEKRTERYHFPRLAWWLGRPQQNDEGKPGAGAYNFRSELIFQLTSVAEQELQDDLIQEFLSYDSYLQRLDQLNPTNEIRISTKTNFQETLKDLLSAMDKLKGGGLHNNIAAEDLRGYVENIVILSATIIHDKASNIRSMPPLPIQSHSLSREAATNEALKSTLKAINEDLQDEYVNPMFETVRSQMVNNGVSVGVFQRTSVLASNRFSARVSPSASSSLEVGETQNVLADLMDLVKLVGTVSTGGAGLVATAAIGGGASAVASAAGTPTFSYPKDGRQGAISSLEKTTAALESLDRLPSRTTPPGVYGVTTGNTFEVTPIVDPTGQAMHFKFDHVLSTPITEPNGVTNTQLPRIERHSVNTDVQLSNNEIRVISQFDSNVKLGLPEKYYGGIPIIRDFFPKVPILGYFTKTSGKAGEVQQSLILAQATLFPTIGDVIGLLTERN